MNPVWILNSVFRQKETCVHAVPGRASRRVFETWSDGREGASGCSTACSVGGLCAWLLFFTILDFFVDKNNMLLYESAEITRFSLLESIDDEDDLLRHIV